MANSSNNLVHANEPAHEHSARENGFTLFHLLEATAFAMPIVSVVMDLKRVMLRYGLGLPLSLAAGALIVVVERNTARLIWSRTQRQIPKILTAAAVASLVILIFSIALGTIIGQALAVLLIKHID